eukprot:352958-Chlamydomonas_euryale.AAC.8
MGRRRLCDAWEDAGCSRTLAAGCTGRGLGSHWQRVHLGTSQTSSASGSASLVAMGKRLERCRNDARRDDTHARARGCIPVPVTHTRDFIAGPVTHARDSMPVPVTQQNTKAACNDAR